MDTPYFVGARAAVLLGALTIALVGCTVLEGDTPPTVAPSPQSSSPAVAPSPAPSPESLTASWLESEVLLGELSSIRGTSEIGPVESESGFVVIYVKCYGTGSIKIELIGAASFEQPCRTDGETRGTRNQIQTLAPDEVVVRGSAKDSNLWAIAVVEGESQR